MTRDEAIKLAKVDIGFGAYEKSGVEIFVDRLSALGILKLDEPKTIHQRIDEAVRQNLYAESVYSQNAVYIAPHYIMGVLDRAGLRVVDK